MPEDEKSLWKIFCEGRAKDRNFPIPEGLDLGEYAAVNPGMSKHPLTRDGGLKKLDYLKKHNGLPE